MAIWGGEGAKSRIERDLFVLGSRLTVEVQLTVVTISLTTRERRTEPGDRVRAPQSVEGIFFSICLFLFSIRFFYFSFFLSIYIYIYVRMINISNIHRNRSCQESNHGRAVARARRGTLSQHSGFSNQFHSQFHFPRMIYLSILVFSIHKFRSPSREICLLFVQKSLMKLVGSDKRLHRHRGYFAGNRFSKVQRHIYIYIMFA